MGDHQWVQLQMTPVSAKLEDNGEITVEASPEAIQAADGDKRYGCWFCDVPLTVDTIGSDCISSTDATD